MWEFKWWCSALAATKSILFRVGVRRKPALFCCCVTCALLLRRLLSYNDTEFFLLRRPMALKFFPAVTTDVDEDCLKARKDTVPRHLHGRSYMNKPVINLGMPKMGSTSIQHFFGCAGYGASHWLCGRDQICARCIPNSVKAGLPPLEKCGEDGGPIYTQIDGWGSDGKLYFPQITLLKEIIEAYPNGTYVLAFRSMEGWYTSVTNWKSPSNRTLKSRMIRSFPGLVGGSLQNFTDFFCNHVKHVRKIVPPGRLVEVDIDVPAAGRLLSEIFDIDENCWKKTNVNEKIQPMEREINERKINSVPHQSGGLPMLIKGKAMIRGKNGVLRKNPSNSTIAEEMFRRRDGEDWVLNSTYDLT